MVDGFFTFHFSGSACFFGLFSIALSICLRRAARASRSCGKSRFNLTIPEEVMPHGLGRGYSYGIDSVSLSKRFMW